jgi:glycosyltransferase involved in cell wall biosynthesis
MRILFIIEELNGGGKERRLVELLKGLSKLSGTFDIHLTFTKVGIDYNEVEELNVSIHRLAPTTNLNLISQYKNHFRNLNPDIVHTWSLKTSFYASILKPFFNYKIIAGFVSNTFRLPKPWQLICDKLIYKKANVIVSNSKAGLIAYKVPINKGHCIYNGFDSERLSTSITQKKNLNALGIFTKYTMVMVANVTNKKDYKSFINVANDLTKTRNDVSFISVGKIMPEYEDMVAPYVDNRHPKIKFIGFYEKPELLIQESDIGVLCSDCEGVSNAILEYMAAGLPVVTTDLIGATKELVRHERTGFICSKKNLLEILIKLLDNERLRLKMGDEGSKLIKDKFNINIMLNEYVKLYNKLCDIA